MFSRRTCKGGKEKLWDLAAKPLHGPGRRFVTGVAAGICRRPDDRPSAETHPPNNSMNVYLVDSRSGDTRRDGSPGAFYSVRFFSAGPLEGPLCLHVLIGLNSFFL
jgi:hypothetical protein